MKKNNNKLILINKITKHSKTFKFKNFLKLINKSYNPNISSLMITNKHFNNKINFLSKIIINKRKTYYKN